MFEEKPLPSGNLLKERPTVFRTPEGSGDDPRKGEGQQAGQYPSAKWEGRGGFFSANLPDGDYRSALVGRGQG